MEILFLNDVNYMFSIIVLQHIYIHICITPIPIYLLYIYIPHCFFLSDNVPLPATPVTAFYHGCMDITVSGHQLDFDEALSKHNSIKSHSCPPASAPETHGDAPRPHRK